MELEQKDKLAYTTAKDTYDQVVADQLSGTNDGYTKMIKSAKDTAGLAKMGYDDAKKKLDDLNLGDPTEMCKIDAFDRDKALITKLKGLVADLKASKKVDTELEDWSNWAWASEDVAPKQGAIMLPKDCETSFNKECFNKKMNNKTDLTLSLSSLSLMLTVVPLCVVVSYYSYDFCLDSFTYMMVDYFGW